MPSNAAPLSTREQVLASVRTASTPPTVDELASALGLHRNSVRLHAAALQRSGLITQESRADGGRGRPRTTYRTTPSGARTGHRDYEPLASALISNLRTSSGDPESAARRAGRAWGERLTPEDPDDPQHVVAVLAELGFEPDRREQSVDLRNCPFRELVDDDGMVCTLHAGMLDGLLTGSRTTATLTPFTTQNTCTIHLTRR